MRGGLGARKSYRQDGKVKQQTIADLDRKDFLETFLPQMERVLRGCPKSKRTQSGRQPLGSDLATCADGAGLFEALRLRQMFDGLLGGSRLDVPYPDRVRADCESADSHQERARPAYWFAIGWDAALCRVGIVSGTVIWSA